MKADGAVGPIALSYVKRLVSRVQEFRATCKLIGCRHTGLQSGVALLGVADNSGRSTCTLPVELLRVCRSREINKRSCEPSP